MVSDIPGRCCEFSGCPEFPRSLDFRSGACLFHGRASSGQPFLEWRKYAFTLAVRWATSKIPHQEGPVVHVSVCSHCIDVLSWCKCVVPDSKTDHCLRDPVSKVWHISLVEFEGTISGEVHDEGENEDPTVDAYVPSGALFVEVFVDPVQTSSPVYQRGSSDLGVPVLTTP